MLNGYIVAEGPDGLYLIDQHAAHERIRYDKVKQQREQQKPEVQGLLEPATFEVTPRQDAVMRSCLENLADFGFTLEAFGDRTYLVRTVPALVAGDDWSAMLKELLDALSGEERSRWEEKMVASIACHGAVKAGQTLKRRRDAGAGAAAGADGQPAYLPARSADRYPVERGAAGAGVRAGVKVCHPCRKNTI